MTDGSRILPFEYKPGPKPQLVEPKKPSGLTIRVSVEQPKPDDDPGPAAR
jgi:hypothetical protein